MSRHTSNLFVLILLIIFSFSCKYEKSLKTYKIFSIGDSTMANKNPKKYPDTGWCQVLHQFFDKSVIIKNYAASGRSTKSFIDEGSWLEILDSLSAGDYVLIQFGHNDQKEQDSSRYAAPFGLYKQNLEKFVKETRSKEAIPILCTPIARRNFNDSGRLKNTHGDYPDVVREVSKTMKVDMIDLNKLSTDLVNKMGVEASKEIYLWTAPNDKYPDGRKDNTHLSEKGAKAMAGMAVRQLLEMKVSFKNHINKQVFIK